MRLMIKRDNGATKILREGDRGSGGNWQRDMEKKKFGIITKAPSFYPSERHWPECLSGANCSQAFVVSFLDRNFTGAGGWWWCLFLVESWGEHGNSLLKV